MSDRRRPPFVLLLLVMGGGACGRTADGVLPAPDADTTADTPVPTAVAEVGAVAEAAGGEDSGAHPAPEVQTEVQTDSGADLPLNDASARSPADDEVSRYRKFLTDIEDVNAARETECFRAWPDSLRRARDGYRRPELNEQISGEQEDQRLAFYVRSDLIDFDEGVAATCLLKLGSVSCQEIAAAYESRSRSFSDLAPECAAVLVGKVPKGSACTENRVCGPSLTCAVAPGRLVCSVCVEKVDLKLGASCEDGGDCEAGTVCTYDDNRGKPFCLHPPEPTKQSLSCSDGGPRCAPDLFCAKKVPYPLTDSSDGICRPLQLGIPCVGPGDCFFSYHVCAGVTSDHGGTCQLGKGEHQPCAIIDYQEDSAIYRFSDCAPYFVCLDLDGQGRKCVADSPLGGPCGVLDLQSSVSCREGYCDGAHDNIPGVCRPLKAAGTPCEWSRECAVGDFCYPPSRGQPAVCLAEPHVVPAVGEHCAIAGVTVNGCGFGAYCAPPPDFDGVSFSRDKGFCAPWIKTGEKCREIDDRCEPLSACINGVCTGC